MTSEPSSISFRQVQGARIETPRPGFTRFFNRLLSERLCREGVRDRATLRQHVTQASDRLTFGVVYQHSSHTFPLRQWLRTHRIDPDRDIQLVVVPPAQVHSNLKAGNLDGYCVGEPWNSLAIADDIGFTSLNTQDIWKDHPEKVCAFTGEFAEKNPEIVKAVLNALHEASVWLDVMENRREQAKIAASPSYINCPEDVILGRLQGKYLFGDGRKLRDPNYMIFSSRNCNYPQAKYAKWWLAQFRRWGLVEGAPDYEGVAKQVMRGDLYTEAMKEIGDTAGVPDDSAETLFDGVKIDPKSDLEAYAKGSAVHSMKG